MSKAVNPNCQIITTVGIDIGTTTTQLVVSRLTIKNTAPGTSAPRMEITEKKVLYRSQIHFTPLLDDHHIIDAEEVKRIVLQEFRTAGLTPEEIDTGAVIVTGETAKKENAKKIVESMAGLAGDFVVATAGVNLEAILAGKGSGAAGLSREKHCVAANVDVGGGTSNIGVFKNGIVIDTACSNLGGHLIEIERGGDKITYIADPARVVLRECGFVWQVGQRVTVEELKTLTRVMARCIIETTISRELTETARELLMTPALRLDYLVDKIMFSGGVADFIYSDFRPISVAQVAQYGDVGPLLGWALREELTVRGIVPEKPGETIRATVIGAGTHSLNISGSTITVDEVALPMRNVTVISPFAGQVPGLPEEIAKGIKNALERVVTDGSGNQVALAIDGPTDTSFVSVQALAEGIISGASGFINKDNPLIVVLYKDCAKALGQTLKIMLGPHSEIVCIDQLRVDEGDYIDIGKPIMGGRTVPVVIKTLVFDNLGASS